LDWCFLCNSMLAMNDADGFVFQIYVLNVLKQ
jgi:hypothetical protein